MKLIKQFGNPPLSKRTSPLSTNSPIPEHFFHDPPLCPNFKSKNLTLILGGRGGNYATYNHSHKKQIVWKHEPNWPFYAFLLRTKLYQNPFFFTGHQNLNKPKSRAARTVYGLIFLPFYKIIVSFFFFFMSRCKQNKIKLCYSRLQFVKETQTNTV